MATVLNMLEEILRLEQIEENIFRAAAPTRISSGSSAARWPARPWWPPDGPSA